MVPPALNQEKIHNPKTKLLTKAIFGFMIAPNISIGIR
jgi:hypothetical protein